MILLRIEGATHVLGPPRNWNAERDGDCGEMAVRVVNTAGPPRFESAWEPTPDELAALNAGAPVILSVVGGQPPVYLYVRPAGGGNGGAGRDEQ